MADAAASFKIDAGTKLSDVVALGVRGLEGPTRGLLRLTAEAPGAVLEGLPRCGGSRCGGKAHVTTRLASPFALLAGVPLELHVLLCGASCSLPLELHLEGGRSGFVAVQAELWLGSAGAAGSRTAR